jgi:hypothetical protein
MMPFPARVNSPLEPNDIIDGYIEFLGFTPPEIVGVSSLRLRLPLCSLISFLPSSQVFSPLFISTHTHPSSTACRRSTPLVIFVYLSMIEQRRTEKSVAVPRNSTVLFSTENSSPPSLPNSNPSQTNLRFVTSLSQRRSAYRTGPSEGKGKEVSTIASSAVQSPVHHELGDGESGYAMILCQTHGTNTHSKNGTLPEGVHTQIREPTNAS